MKRAIAIAVPAAALLALGAYLATPASESTPVPDIKHVAADAPHVILISIDTLRADHLGAYGNTRVRTPELDAFAAEGIVFEHNISAAPTTLASHTSMFTGNYPHTHGAAKNDFIVNDDNLMLQEVLNAAGYDTAAFLGSIPIASHSNFTQGFAHIDERFTLHRNGDGVAQTMRDGKDVSNAVLSWAKERPGDKPLFLFAHYFDVHSPYLPPEPYRSWYEPDNTIKNAGTMGHIASTRRLLKRNEPDAKRHSDTLRELYLGGVSYADHQVGRLLNGLKEQGILDNAIVLITSDHGEAFDTHSELWDHGYTVYDETVHTPLIVRLPHAERAGSRVSEQTSSVDIFPTLLDYLQLASIEVEGVSWRAGLEGKPMPERPPAFSEATKPGSLHDHTWKNDPMQKSVRDDGYKYVLTPRKRVAELYHVAEDVGELHDLLVDPAFNQAPLRDQMNDTLAAWRAEANPLSSEPLSSARVRAELAALGYVDALEDPNAPNDTDAQDE